MSRQSRSSTMILFVNGTRCPVFRAFSRRSTRYRMSMEDHLPLRRSPYGLVADDEPADAIGPAFGVEHRRRRPRKRRPRGAWNGGRGAEALPQSGSHALRYPLSDVATEASHLADERRAEEGVVRAGQDGDGDDLRG